MTSAGVFQSRILRRRLLMRGRRFEILGGPSRQVGSLLEELAEQLVGVLVRWPLPRGVGVGEEDSRPFVERELGVAG
jgi:hypothetical protein